MSRYPQVRVKVAQMVCLWRTARGCATARVCLVAACVCGDDDLAAMARSKRAVTFLDLAVLQLRSLRRF
jgi:hypothetical protein